MAKQRYIDTRFWHDTFIQEQLNPLDRYLFLYFLTNDKTNICGCYEIPLSIVAAETGLTREMLLKMMKRLKGKIDYIDGWVTIHNFQKYQNLNNPKIVKGIEECIKEIPNKIKQKLEKIQQNDKLSITNQDQSHSNSNSNSNIKSAEISSAFSLREELNKLKTDPKRHINLIGEYLEEKKIVLESKDQLGEAIKRHARAAMALSKFSDKQIGNATVKAEKEYPDYTLETLVKIITR